MIAGVEYLKGGTYSNVIDSNKIAFYGASHGGLTGAVVMNMKPDLFQAVVLQNANVDLINILPQKGRSWIKQYGDITIKEDFQYLKKYTPLLHVHRPSKPEESYPITLVVVSKKDEEVPFTSSLKYLAHRRAKAEDNHFQKNKPILLKIINSGGHNYRTASKTEYIETVFVKLKFLAEAMQMKVDKKYQLIEIVEEIPEIEQPGLLFSFIFSFAIFIFEVEV